MCEAALRAIADDGKDPGNYDDVIDCGNSGDVYSCGIQDGAFNAGNTARAALAAIAKAQR